VFRLFAQLNSTTASVGIHDPVLFGNPVNFNVVLDQSASSNTKEGLFFILIVKRAITVKALVVFIVMANCTSASHYTSVCLAMVVSMLHLARGCHYSVLMDNYRLIFMARNSGEGDVCGSDRGTFRVYVSQIKYARSACRIW